jgi:hypothetical protein
LPRPVGVASDDEMLCIQIENDTSVDEDCISIKARDSIKAQLPQGLELFSVNIFKANTSFQPCSAKYILRVKKQYLCEELEATIKGLLASERLDVQRRIIKRKSRIGARASAVKNINVRDFLESIELEHNSIIVQSKITPAGSIRIEEILSLLGLDMEKLASPIRRTGVQWRCN